jgi:elongation of very long chain fatty acids protein 6
MFDLRAVDLHSNESFLYSHMFGFERQFGSREFINSLSKSMQKHWTWSIIISLLYIMSIFSIKFYMQNQPRYELRKPLVIWNVFLAAFSIIGTIRTLPEFLYSVTQKGIVHSVCSPGFVYGVPGFWGIVFVMSKLVELIDTLFIVLRKQKLIFLHWYHHATVLIYCCFSYSELTASGRWFTTMNYLIHSIMYSYYACKALKIRVPLFISKLITTSQLVQMILGCYVNWVVYQTKKYSPQTECNVSNKNIFYSFLMYCSYFVLFFHFFFNAYVLKKKERQVKSTSNGPVQPNGKKLD